MKVHVAWEHSSFKILDLVAIGSFDPRAQKSRSSKFRQILIFLPEIFGGLSKIEEEKSEIISKKMQWSQMSPFLRPTIFFLIKKFQSYF